ncbi:hypothetical protein [Deefgea sp. CFH1-16]|uniref:hypothetical protein n=1 Tax=Deefgea sp. CFH1-16 TaxID=2675457 RepID=UPI0015F4F75D|nr:hypothetical protein [Deefgea sp. CFH1-16]MBM5575367.1 hypothetical protein [Deefgea sp. CFH1-16]
MNAANILKFGEHQLWCLTASNLDAALSAISNREVDGLFISQFRGYTGHSLACLEKFEDLKILAIDDLQGVDISNVEKIESLEYLSIGNVDTSIQLAGLSKLRHLRLQAGKNKCLPKIGLANLHNLAIWNFSESDLSILEGYPELESLEIIQAKKLISLEGIEACKKLSCVVLSYCPALHNINALIKLNLLQSFELKNTKKIHDYVALGKLVHLKKLIIDKAGSLQGVHAISNLKKLEHLVIIGSPILDNNLAPLKLLPSLTHVYLDNKKEYEPILGELKKMVLERKNSN